MSSITDDAMRPQEGTGPKSTNTILIDKECDQTASSQSNDGQNHDEKDRQLNKYKWPEFAGFQGERYLESVVQAILPWALFRTWHNLTIREAPSLGAYAGVAKMAKVSSRCERKIYQDLAEFSERGLLEMSKGWRPVVSANGTSRMQLVTIKNFERLYDLAHEYHIWNQDAFYIDPQRENAEFIIQNPELFRKLLRFECYRKILLCRKPGPKATARQSWYNQTIDELLATAHTILSEDAERAKNSKSDEKDVIVKEQLPEQLPEHSLYRSNPTENTNGDTIPKASTSERGTTSPATTIRIGNEQQSTVFQTETKHQNRIEIKTELMKTEYERGAAAAKDAMGYSEQELKQDMKKRGAAAAGISADQYRKLNGGQDQREQEQARQREQEQAREIRQERERPAQVVATIGEYARQYDDPELVQSDITRALKLYFTAEETFENFNQQLFWNVYSQAKEAAGKYASKHSNRAGRTNRVPYLFACMENEFQFSLEELVYLRTEDPLYMEYSLYDVIETLQATYKHQYHQRETNLDYRAWLLDILDKLEKRTEPRTRNNPTQRDY